MNHGFMLSFMTTTGATIIEPCPACDGHGTIIETIWDREAHGTERERTCPTCDGLGAVEYLVSEYEAEPLCAVTCHATATLMGGAL